MPGYVNFFYKNGKIPTHTKRSFNELQILTVHNIIATNALTFMHKVHNFPSSLPQSVRGTIASDAPTSGNSHEDCESWLGKYSNCCYRNTLFYKGPLIYSDAKYSSLIVPATIISYKVYRNRTKQLLLQAQIQGDAEEWTSSNFALNNIDGLRKSKRNIIY